MKRLFALAMAVCMLFSVTGCAGGDSQSGTVLDSGSSAMISETPSGSEAESEPADEAQGSEVSAAAQESGTQAPVKVAALKGPTAMGMVQMMEDTDSYEFTLGGAADEITPLIVQGEVDIAAVPANLASVLYNKTDGGVTVLDINTLGVLYILEKGDTVRSVADLKGKTIFASGKGATPEYALNYMLVQNGIDPENDVTIEYKSEHAECVAALTAAENAVAMLPQPFVTVAQQKNEEIKVVLDMTEQWERLARQDGSQAALVTGVTIVRTEFLKENPVAVARFLEDHAASTDLTNASPAKAAELIEKYNILAAAVAEQAIPHCNITCIKGDEMREKLSSYISILSEQNIESIGGALPDDSFYYTED